MYELRGRVEMHEFCSERRHIGAEPLRTSPGHAWSMPNQIADREVIDDRRGAAAVERYPGHERPIDVAGGLLGETLLAEPTEHGEVTPLVGP